jgi:hypothetical protein
MRPSCQGGQWPREQDRRRIGTRNAPTGESTSTLGSPLAALIPSAGTDRPLNLQISGLKTICPVSVGDLHTGTTEDIAGVAIKGLVRWSQPEFPAAAMSTTGGGLFPYAGGCLEPIELCSRIPVVRAQRRCTIWSPSGGCRSERRVSEMRLVVAEGGALALAVVDPERPGHELVVPDDHGDLDRLSCVCHCQFLTRGGSCSSTRSLPTSVL